MKAAMNKTPRKKVDGNRTMCQGHKLSSPDNNCLRLASAILVLLKASVWVSVPLDNELVYMNPVRNDLYVMYVYV